MLVLHVALHALGAETSLVEGKVLPGLKADHPVVFHLELNAALLSAEAAVRLDDLVRFHFCIPSVRGNPVQSRPELSDQLGNRYWCFGHKSLVDSEGDIRRVPCSRHLPSWAMASDLRRQAGQTSW